MVRRVRYSATPFFDDDLDYLTDTGGFLKDQFQEAFAGKGPEGAKVRDVLAGLQLAIVASPKFYGQERHLHWQLRRLFSLMLKSQQLVVRAAGVPSHDLDDRVVSVPDPVAHVHLGTDLWGTRLV